MTALGCSEYKFLCLEFGKGDSTQPHFPLHGNRGPEGDGTFLMCNPVPCFAITDLCEEQVTGEPLVSL